MAKAGDVKMEVALDRQSKEAIRSLVAAIDRLSDAVVSGTDPEALTDNPEHVATLRRLVEDVKANQNASSGTYPGADGKLRTVEGGALAE